MSDPSDEGLVREATRLFLRLREDPENEQLIEERDAFLARGEAERRAYDQLLRAWQLTGRKRRPRRSNLILILAMLVASVYFANEPLRIFWLADFRTQLERTQLRLASGDSIDLDARSAVIDGTDGDQRRVALLQGAAFFDVDTKSRPFVVEIGALSAHAIGTAFETARLQDAVFVAVSEGLVEVRLNSASWHLTAGERLRWTPDDHVTVEAISIDSVATWRNDRLIADGMTFEQVANVIDRRLPGRIVIYDGALAGALVSGGLDLDEPMQALRTLAAAEEARVISAPGLVTLILPGR